MSNPESISKISKAKPWLKFSGVAAVFIGSAIATITAWPVTPRSLASNTSYPSSLRVQYSSIVSSVHAFETREDSLHYKLVSQDDLDQQLARIQVDATSGRYSTAIADIKSLKVALTDWNLELSGGTTTLTSDSSVAAGGGLNLPILLYHYPPVNFAQQLDHLQQAGYTTIDMNQVLAGLKGGDLPTKPVVITYDDGYSAQMSAFDMLKQRHMKATFYIIVGGSQSKWCIGAGRRYHDPLQPAGGCGDSYLNWNQIRQLDQSGLITIGGHTINHRNLATLSYADQKFEIESGKKQLEKELGHSIDHFAYPYGGFNADSIALTREAGYLTAVTTEPGTYQGLGSEYTLKRVRDAMLLP